MTFHIGQAVFSNSTGESFAGAMELATNGVGEFGERADLLITQLFISDQKQQKAIFIRGTVQRLLNALAKFFRFEDTKRRIGFRRGIVPDGVISIAEHVPLVPGLLKVAAMVDRDPIKPGAPGRFAAKRIHLAERLSETHRECVLGFLRVAQETQRKIINGAGCAHCKCRRILKGPKRFPVASSSMNLGGIVGDDGEGRSRVCLRSANGWFTVVFTGH